MLPSRIVYDVNEAIAIRSISDRPDDRFAEGCLARLEPVWRYVRASVVSFHDAEDLTQDVFAQACSTGRQFTGGDLGAWLYQIARNKVAMYYRKRSVERRGRKIVEQQQAGATAADSDAIDRIDGIDAPERVRAAIAALGEDEREALRLKFSLAYSNTEIAQLLKIDASYLGVIVHRALRKLRRELERKGDARFVAREA